MNITSRESDMASFDEIIARVFSALDAINERHRVDAAPEGRPDVRSNWGLTQLDPNSEQRFQREFRASPFFTEFVQRYGEEPDLNGDYDYRLWWLDGMRAERSPYDGTLHGPSKTKSGRWLKSPDHPTAWKEHYLQQYGVDPDAVQANTNSLLFDPDAVLRGRFNDASASPLDQLVSADGFL